MGTKAQRETQRRKKREDQTAEKVNTIKELMEDAKNVLKSFVLPQNETNMEEARYLYLQGLYMTLK